MTRPTPIKVITGFFTLVAVVQLGGGVLMATSAEMLTLAAASFVSGVLSVIAVTGTWKMRSYGLYAFALMVPIGLLHSFGVFSNEQTTLGVMGIVNWLILLATITYLIGLKSGGQLDRTT